MSIDKPSKMTSAVASSFSSAFAQQGTKKRSYLEVNGSTPNRPAKRLQSLNLPSKLSGTVSRASPGSSKPVVQATGLEDCLKLDQHFVESTKATEDDEARRGLHSPTDPSYDDIISERGHLASQIRPSLDPELGPGKGIPNKEGYLCYRHSLFQALVHTPRFVNWLLDYHQPQDCVSDNPNICVSCQMRELIRVYWDKRAGRLGVERQAKAIHTLFTLLGWQPSSDIGHGDPDDQLAWMLNIMRAEMPSSVFSYFDAFNNTILESQIRCGKCGHVSKTRGNNERHLSIPIKVPGLAMRHLHFLIKAYMDEVIQGYRCENETCKHVSDKHRIQQIAYAPDVLLIQLKRFNFRGNKDHSSVSYGPHLDLSEHSANPSLGPLNYDLTAVISHAGRADIGHYHCIAKGPDGKWIEYNDEHWFESSVEEALKPSLCGQAWTPYLLFYERNKASVPPQ